MTMAPGKITKAFAKKLKGYLSLTTDPVAHTHFICLPLCNDTTRVGLENMVRTLRNDSSLSQLPQKAFRLPRALCLPIIKLKASTTDDIVTILNAFHQLNVARLLSKEFGEDHEINEPGNRNALTCVETSKHTGVADRIVSPEPVTPLNLTLKGLRGVEARNSVGEGFPTLYAGLECPDNRLGNLSHRIGPQFGSMWVHQPLSNDYSRKRGPNVVNLKRTHVTKGSPITVKIHDPTLIERYAHTTWLKDVRLEKLSLCKNGRKSLWSDSSKQTLLDEYYEEIASIPLP